MNDERQNEPLVCLNLAQGRLSLLGTAHVSKASSDKVAELLSSQTYDAVGVELCPSRYNAIINPDSLAKMDLFKVFREGKATMVIASLALGAYQQRIAEQLGVEPGAEMRIAIKLAQEKNLPILLIDREVGITLKRVYSNIPWWKRMNLFAGLVAGIFSREEVDPQQIEQLKQGDLLENTFSQFAQKAQELYHPLITERDLYMSAQLVKAFAENPGHHILAIVGAGHMQGMQRQLSQPIPQPAQVIQTLDALPPASAWPKVLAWSVVLLLFSGFLFGFSRNPSLGWRLILEWVIINGGLSALGALLAGGHILTVIAAFIAAPFTTLNPAIGVGMVTAPVEAYLRKPQVGDFSRLRNDTLSMRGWWHNPVSRTFLVFLFSSLGAAMGTYIAGFRMFEQIWSTF